MNAFTTDFDAHWSKSGRYLTLIHNDKILLLGGTDFETLRSITHHGVCYAEVSPCERFVYSYANSPKIGQGKYIVWLIETGESIREFDDVAYSEEGERLFKWSHDGNFIACQIKDHVCVYELPEMTMIKDQTGEKRSSIRSRAYGSLTGALQTQVLL